MLGPSFINRVRSDIEYMYGNGDSSVMDYFYHCNAQLPRYAFVNELYKIISFVQLMEYRFYSESR